MFGTIKQIVERSDTPSGKAFDLVVQAMIVTSLVAFTIETLPNLPSSTAHTLQVVEALSVLLFTCEYITRLAVADRPLRFAFSFFGMVDLLAILPFYLALGFDLRSVRALRLLRLFRILKMARYNRAIHRLQTALKIAREELVLFSCVALLMLYLSAVGIYFFEHEAQPEAFASVPHCLWWALTTLTTVGYGDIYPVTLGGRLFTFAVLVVGLGIVAIPPGLIASALTKAREIVDAPQLEITELAIEPEVTEQQRSAASIGSSVEYDTS